ncbi:hypothetical protein [Rhodoferax saidenbachensis]|uniref:Uncharacterized protein n=1 Tax=Rhodoferax saidenbachensis TaxID=1484693 RepID=A0A1P8KCP9_9BURK|nr:hypothetical protein [Rhodoferax saidenbachensis]APW43803.1 hypothetical protein RS694_15500 [Rhodoferax saidenbachensis]
MNIEQIRICIQVLDHLAAGFATMHDNHNAAQAGLSCVVAQSLVVEYAAHRTDGMEHEQAMEATAGGQLNLNEASASLYAMLTAKPEDQ